MRTPFFRSLFVGLAASVLGMGLAASALAQAKTRLVVVSTLEVEHIAKFKEAFEADNPDIEISWARDSTGVVTARLLAEKDNPRADAIWGLAATSMLLLDREGVLQPYAPANLAAIKPAFRDPRDPPHWVGMEAWAAALCFNTIEAEKLKLPRPASWFDLLDPAFKGRLAMPHPASSGTGYFHVAAWLQMFGEEAAWRFMDRLHDNIAVYLHSGSTPCRLASTGEYAVGISYELAGANAKQIGAPDRRAADEGRRRLGHGCGRAAQGHAPTRKRRSACSTGRRAIRPTSSTAASSARSRSRGSRRRGRSIRRASRNR